MVGNPVIRAGEGVKVMVDVKEMEYLCSIGLVLLAVLMLWMGDWALSITCGPVGVWWFLYTWANDYDANDRVGGWESWE